MGIVENSLLSVSSSALKQIILCEISIDKITPNLAETTHLLNVAKGNIPKLGLTLALKNQVCILILSS